VTITPIAHMHSEFSTKFGIPRQSGLVPELRGTIVFEPTYRNREALRGLEEVSHLWIIWGFSAALRDGWSPTVRPPRLGGNARLGVFATRSPFRPNPLGLSAVSVLGVEDDAVHGSVIRVSGADLMDGTPIYDLKPYLPYADCISNATSGFAAGGVAAELTVRDPLGLLDQLSADCRVALVRVLALDPRPGYIKDPERVHGMEFAGFEVRFRVAENLLEIIAVAPV